MELEKPNNFNLLPKEIQDNIIAYLFQLTPIEKKAYTIAINHLGSSFNLLKSNGYQEWIENRHKK